MFHNKQKSAPPSMRELLSETTTKSLMQQSLTLQNVMQQSMSLQGVMQQSMTFHSIHVKHLYRKKQIVAFFIRSIPVCNPNFMMQQSLRSTESDSTYTKKDIVWCGGHWYYIARCSSHWNYSATCSSHWRETHTVWCSSHFGAQYFSSFL